MKFKTSITNASKFLPRNTWQNDTQLATKQQLFAARLVKLISFSRWHDIDSVDDGQRINVTASTLS